MPAPKSDLLIGIRYGAGLSALVVVLGILGNAQEFKWVPEVPLLAVTAATPIAICGAAGWRVARVLGSVRLGTAAGGIAGIMGGLTGGIFFVVIGKPVVDVPVLLVLGLVGGTIAGFLGGIAARRWRPA